MSCRQLVVAYAAAILAGLVAPSATADDKIPLGGGARIIVNGSAHCTLATIGHDSTGQLVGFTAARCGGIGAPVTAEGNGGAIGGVGVADEDLGYAVIKLDPAKVNPLAVFDGFPINGIGSDPGFGQQVCTEGGATGSACGSITVSGKPGSITANLPAWELGDDGAPITVAGQLVGLIVKGHVQALLPAAATPRGQAQIRVALFSAIMNDINAKGGPGAGFSPIAA
jgi:hypothetical protein